MVARGWVVDGFEGDAAREPPLEGPDDPDCASAAPMAAANISPVIESPAIEVVSSLDMDISSAATVGRNRIRSMVNGTNIEWFPPLHSIARPAQALPEERWYQVFPAELLRRSSRQSAPNRMAATKPNESAMSTPSHTVAASMRERTH